jgi:hypothetical protein
VNVPQYPDPADEIIRHAAGLVNQGNPLIVLDLIRDKLLGDADKVAELGRQWAANTVMQDTRTDLQTTRDVLGSYWQGPAYAQFDKYAANLVGNLDTNQTVIGNFGATLGKCGETVMSAYSNAVKLIAQTAADLLNIGALAGTLLVPGLDLITGPALLLKVIDKLSDFVKGFANLIAESMNQIASYHSSGISFAFNANNFRVPEPLGPGTAAGLGNANQWHVTPYNK